MQIERQTWQALLPAALLLAGVCGWQPLAHAQSPCQSGPGYFDYGPHRGNPEAEQLAMHLTGQLRAPEGRVAV